MGQEVFLIDSSSFITPYQTYYAFDLVPPYWDELGKQIGAGRVVVLDMVKSELDKGGDALSNWITNLPQITVVPTATANTINWYQQILQYVNSSGLYKPGALTAWSVASVADPWIIAAAKDGGYTIVTEEIPSSSLSTKNPCRAAKIPDVARNFGVPTIKLFEMMRRLGIVIN